MYRAILLLFNTGCVTHLYVHIIPRQCAATLLFIGLIIPVFHRKCLLWLCFCLRLGKCLTTAHCNY